MNMKRSLKLILLLILLPVFLYSGVQVYRICSAYASAEAQYDALTMYVSPPSSPPPQTEDAPVAAPEVVPAEPQTDAVEPSETPEEALWPQVDFQALSAINPDIVAWILIDGTGIHYPVVQGQDNDFYLNHQFDKSANRAGCLFLDAANDASFADLNSIIYGHYTKDRSMFYELRGYKQQDFFDAHPTGWLITPSAVYKLRFFSGYVSDVYSAAWDMDFTEKDYRTWLNDCIRQSFFAADIRPDENSRVLTLSTCSYEFENARFVLHAVLEEQQQGA